MTIPELFAELIALTPRIAAAPSEAAADRLRIQRLRVSDEIVRRTGGVR